MSKKQLSFKDLIDNVAHYTGYQKKVVESILRTHNDVIVSAIENGYGIKNHKLFRLEVVEEESRKAWDGINKEYYTLPERYVLRYKGLSRLTNAIEQLNEDKKGIDKNKTKE